MTNPTRRTALAMGIALISTATFMAPAFAGKAPVFGTGNAAASGYDVVAYFAEGRPVDGSDAYVAQHDGATWRFSSAANRDAFIADPPRYAPQFGGYCAYAVSQRYTASTVPDAWKIVGDRSTSTTQQACSGVGKAINAVHHRRQQQLAERSEVGRSR